MRDIKTLEGLADIMRSNIKVTQRQLELQEKNLKEVEDAIAAARLQAWYAANPGVELRVGDQLAVTDEFMESSTLGAVWWKGEDYPVEEIYFLHSEGFPSVLIYETDGGNPEYVPMDTARRMREAWLAKEAGA